uniref:Coronatine-insensitive protein 1 n=1 Tax=Kalanchoe fedtschenkoi TaxID=63787 RepID=A0A7N0ZW98_KALFE
MKEQQERSKVRREATMMDEVFDYVISYIDDPRDRCSVSLVCRRWYQLDALTRKQVTVASCYSTTPQRLTRRFPHLEALKLKGKPRASMFNLIPDNWGGYVTPWVNEIVLNLNRLRSVHFRRMIVTDPDLEALATARGPMLHELKLDKCSDFSTDGLLHVTRSCRNIKVLFLEESRIHDNGGQWLHEIAVRNTVLEILNFYNTDLAKVAFQDLELISRNCRSLKSVKTGEWEIIDLLGFFRSAASLEEFGGGSYNRPPEDYSVVSFPATIRRLGLTYMGRNELPIVFPIGSVLTKLDLVYALLETEDHCNLIRKCPNLEVLETRNVIGDRGLEMLAVYCKKLKRLRIERGADEQGMEDEEGTCLKKLRDFRLVLLDREEIVTDLPLDNGVRALLMGCRRLVRFALYLRPGGLTDVGLSYIGMYSNNVRWMLLGHVGETDAGLLEFSRGCPSLQKLEMRGCCFSERALAFAVTQLRSLRFLWVQGYTASIDGRDLYYMQRPYWNIELIPARRVVIDQNEEEFLDENPAGMHPAQILAYYSLVGPRTDYPDTVVPLYPQPPPIQHPLPVQQPVPVQQPH